MTNPSQPSGSRSFLGVPVRHLPILLAAIVASAFIYHGLAAVARTGADAGQADRCASAPCVTPAP